MTETWAVSSVAVQVAKALLLLGSQVVLARLLGPADFGIVAMCAPVFGLCCLFNDLGLSQAAIQRPSLSVQDSNNIFWINLALGCVLALLLLLLAPAAASFYSEPRVADVLAALSAVIIVNNLSFQQVALMHRRMEPVPILLIDIVPVVANLITSISAALLGWGYWSLVVGQMAHALAAGLLAWTLSPFRSARPHALAEALPIIRFGAHLTGLSLASFAATSLSPLVIGRMFGAWEVGFVRPRLQARQHVLRPVSHSAVPDRGDLVGPAVRRPQEISSSPSAIFRSPHSLSHAGPDLPRVHVR